MRRVNKHAFTDELKYPLQLVVATQGAKLSRHRAGWPLFFNGANNTWRNISNSGVLS